MPTHTSDELLRLAREDIARNQLSSAESTLEQAVLLDSTQIEAHVLLGQIYAKRGKFKKAVMALERSLEMDPFHTEAAISLSALYNDLGRYESGAALFRRTKLRLEKTLPGHDPRISQTLARKHFDLGMLYMRFERFQEAQHEFMKCRNLDPDFMPNHVQIAKVLSKMGQKEHAIGILRKVLETNPASVEVKIQLGVLYHSVQNLDEASREWHEAIALEPGNASAQMYLSMLE